MFDIGFFELVVVAIVALVVIGPEQLPGTLRTLGLWIGRIKRGVQSTRDELERQIGADDIRRQLHNEEVMKRLNASKAEIEKMVRFETDTVSSSHNSIGKKTDTSPDTTNQSDIHTTTVETATEVAAISEAEVATETTAIACDHASDNPVKP